MATLRQSFYDSRFMTQETTVAVIAHIANSAQLSCLIECLEALKGQQTRFVLLLIDNASPSGPTGYADELAKRGAVRREVNNLGAARNQAVELAETPFLAFVDSDVRLPAGWLARLEGEMKKSPEVVAVASPLIPDTRTTFGEALSIALASPLAHLGTPQAHRPRRPVRTKHLATAAVLYRREALVAVGGFDARFSRVCEDLEMSQRLLRNHPQGFRLLDAPEVVHNQDVEFAHWLQRVFRYGWGQVEVMRVHPRFIVSSKILPLLALMAIATLFLFALFRSALPLLAFAVQYFAVTAGVVGGLAMGRGRSQLWFLAWSIVVGTHLFYAIGEAAGAVGLKRNPKLS